MIQAYSPKKSVFYILFFSILGKPLGLLTTVLTAYYFGTGKDLDAFLWCSSFLILAGGVIVGSWPLVIIPILTKIESMDKNQAQGYISSLLSYGTLLILLFGICIYVFAEPIVRALTNFEPDTHGTTVNILKSMVLYFVFNSIFQIEQAIFNCYRNFKTPAILTYLSRILVILSMVFLTNSIFINSMVVGRILSSMLQFGVTLFIILKMKIVFSLRLNCDWRWIKQTIIMLLPFYVTEVFNSGIEIFYRYMASGLDIGALSYLNYGFLIKDLVIETLVITLSTVMFTEFSRSCSTNDLKTLKNNFYKSIFNIWYLIIPISVFLFFFSDCLMVLLLKRGAFDNESAKYSSIMVQILSIALFALAGHYFTNRAFFSFHDSHTNMVVMVPNTLLIIIIYYYLTQLLSVTGIALATTISAIWSFWLYLFILSRKHLKIRLSRFFIKMMIFGIISFICFGIFKYTAYKGYNPFQSDIVTLIVRTTAAFLIPSLLYFLVTWFLKIPEAFAVYGYMLQAKNLMTSKMRNSYNKLSTTKIKLHSLRQQ